MIGFVILPNWRDAIELMVGIWMELQVDWLMCNAGNEVDEG